MRHTGTSWALTGLVATTRWATAELWNAFLLARSALGSDVLNMVEVTDQPDNVGESDEKGKSGFTRIPGLPRSVSDDRNSVALRTRLSRDFPALLVRERRPCRPIARPQLFSPSRPAEKTLNLYPTTHYMQWSCYAQTLEVPLLSQSTQRILLNSSARSLIARSGLGLGH